MDMGRLIEGCINPIIKKQLLLGIDQSCEVGHNQDVLCTEFRDQLSEVKDCQTYKELQEPAQKKNTEPKPLTPYQKHMSVCLTRPGEGFYQCIEKWKLGQKMSEDYIGSGLTKQK